MTPSLTESSRDFLDYVDNWIQDLPFLTDPDWLKRPAAVALISVDVINGFCNEGPLSSPRVKAIIPPIVSLLTLLWEKGVRHFLLSQDTHEPDAVEFGQFPPHCIRGTAEADTVPEFKALPFYSKMIVFEKNSIHSGLNTGLHEWLSDHPEVDTFLVVGDCTDLCAYQLAMHLRLEANSKQVSRRVILPAVCVDTYDLTVRTAQEIGAVPHHGDLLHAIFLYHMSLNGIEVIRGVR